MTTQARAAEPDFHPPPPLETYFNSVLGAWILSRHADVYTALREPALRQVSADGDLLTSDDAARHSQLYAEVQADMSRLSSAEWRAQIEATADKFIAHAANKGRADVVRHVIQPWSSAVLMCLSRATPPHAKRLDAISSRLFYPAKRGSNNPLSNRWNSFRRRRAQSELNRMTERKEFSLSRSMFAGLTQTLPSFLAKSWLALLRHPEQSARLRADPTLMPGGVDELLRYAGIVHTLYRRAAADIAIGDVQIASGQRVILKMASANFDPRKFSDPEKLDFTRRPTQHLGLGTGPHACVGAVLVRMATTTITPLFLAAAPRLDTAPSIEWTGDNTLRWPLVVPVRFPR